MSVVDHTETFRVAETFFFFSSGTVGRTGATKDFRVRGFF